MIRDGGDLAKLQGKVEMIAHQAEGMDTKSEVLTAFLHQMEKGDGVHLP